MRPLAIMLVAALALAGCSTAGSTGAVTPQPVGFGKSPNALKRTPCACVLVPQIPAVAPGEDDARHG